MANRAHQYREITITVLDVTKSTCTYKMKSDSSNSLQKPFEAHNFNDHYVLQGLRPGKSYVVKQVVDSRDITHWELALELDNLPMSAKHQAAKEQRAVTNKLLDF